MPIGARIVPVSGGVSGWETLARIGTRPRVRSDHHSPRMSRCRRFVRLGPFDLRELHLATIRGIGLDFQGEQY